MSFDYLNLIKYIKTDDEGRNCPVCMSQLMYLFDGITGVFKCLDCGYSRKAIKGIPGQHRYDLPVTILTAKTDKTAWYELHQPLDERLYNIMVQHDWSADQAVKSVIKDLNMSKDEIYDFIEKIKSLSREVS